MVYRWPGNVRELENCIECAVAFARYDRIMIDDFPERIRGYRVDWHRESDGPQDQRLKQRQQSVYGNPGTMKN